MSTSPTRRRSGALTWLLGRPWLRFLAVGGSAAAMELATFELLVRAGLSAAPANVLSFVVGLLLSFTGYRLWSFAGDHTISGRTQFVSYVALALVNVSITSAVIHAAVAAGATPWMAKAGCMAMVTTWNFFILNRVIFRRPVDGVAREPAGER